VGVFGSYGEYALRDFAGSVDPGAYRPDWDVECGGNFFVAEVGERVEKEGVPLTSWHRFECLG